jgi:protein-S-isoprenylcysteine O-methyltransferase Ste14
MQRLMIALGHLLFRYRSVLLPSVFFAALLAGRPQLPFGEEPADTLFRLGAVLLAISGQALRMMTVGYGYIIQGGREGKVYAKQLMTQGLFALCRNPLYLGNLMVALGLALLVNSVAFYAIFVPFILLAYRAMVAAEEHYLMHRFGYEYRRYYNHVPRWWPALGAWRAGTAHLSFNWQRVLAKEYHRSFLLIGTLAGLNWWTAWHGGGASALPSGASMVGIALAWLACYASVRYLKKAGHVRG